MKRIICVLLSVCMLLCLAACGASGEQKVESPPAETAEIEETMDFHTEPNVPAADVEILNLIKAYTVNYRWDDATLLALSEYSNVTIWYDDAARYPEMAQVLEQLSAMQKRSMEDEYDNLLSFAREALDTAPAEFETQVSRLDVLVRRADSAAVSLLSDSQSDYGWIEDFRGMHGTNFDTATGEELKITDVIKDMGKIPDIVLKELNSHMWAGEGYADTVITDYFRNTPEDGIRWTLDYNGVTFYFADGDLAEPGNGSQTATVTFAENPELFEAKYMAVPDAYMVELPLDHSFFTDLNGDDKLEELNVTGWYDTVMDMYAKYGIYTDTDGFYHYEEYYCDGLHPYYVKTADGNHYLYLFCEQNEGPFPQMNLVVYDVTGGGLSRIGERNLGPAYIPTDIIRIPTNPDSLWLDDYDSMAQDAMEYAVGFNGLPELKGESRIVFDPEHMEFAAAAKDCLGGTEWAGYAVVNSESGEVFPLSFSEPDGTALTVSMELEADGTGWLEFKGAYENITWDCDGEFSLWINREDGQRADMTPYTMDTDTRLWLLADLEGYLFWLYET